jgi:hypothetical protein
VPLELSTVREQVQPLSRKTMQKNNVCIINYATSYLVRWRLARSNFCKLKLLRLEIVELWLGKHFLVVFLCFI